MQQGKRLTAGKRVIPRPVAWGLAAFLCMGSGAYLLSLSGKIAREKASRAPDAEEFASQVRGPMETAPGNPAAPPNVKLGTRTAWENNEVAMATTPAGGVIVGWQDSRQFQCCYLTSGDGGRTWEKEVCLPRLENRAHTGDATVAASADGTLYAVCQDYSVSQVRISRSRDDGKSWTPWESVQASPDKPWAVAGKDGQLFISWLGNPGGWKRSTDYGENWDLVRSLGSTPHGTTFGAGTNGFIHILYNQNNRTLSYVRSKDGGITAEPVRVLVPNMGTFCFRSGSSCNPRQHPIVGGGSDSSGRVVAAVWSSTMPGNGSDGDDDVWIIISRDGGDTWTQPIRVNDNTARSRQFQPWAAVDRHGRVHVVWTDLRNDGMFAVYYASAAGSTFGPNVEVTDTRSRDQGFYGDYKGIAIAGDDVLMSWPDARGGGHDIYFARGAGWASAAGSNIRRASPVALGRPAGSGYELNGRRLPGGPEAVGRRVRVHSENHVR